MLINRLLLYSENGDLEDKVHDFCMQLYNKGNRSTYLLSCLIDLINADEKSAKPENIEKVKFALKVHYILIILRLKDYDVQLIMVLFFIFSYVLIWLQFLILCVVFIGLTYLVILKINTISKNMRLKLQFQMM